MHDSDSAINESVCAYFRKVVVAIRLLIVLGLTVVLEKLGKFGLCISHQPSDIELRVELCVERFAQVATIHTHHTACQILVRGDWNMTGLFSHSVGECHHPN